MPTIVKPSSKSRYKTFPSPQILLYLPSIFSPSGNCETWGRDSAWKQLTFLFPPQDYRWWWRNFLVSGGSAFYVLVYAIFYFVNKVPPYVREPLSPSRAGGWGGEGAREKLKCLNLTFLPCVGRTGTSMEPFQLWTCIFLGECLCSVHLEDKSLQNI